MWCSKKVTWQGIEMLPVADEMMNEEVNEAHAQLTWLSSTIAVKENLTNDHLQQLIITYEEKGHQAETLKEQCRRWRNTQYLSEQQKALLTSLESNLVRIEKVSQQMLMQIQKLMNE